MLPLLLRAAMLPDRAAGSNGTVLPGDDPLGGAITILSGRLHCRRRPLGADSPIVVGMT
jgi:hypothetical protein